MSRGLISFLLAVGASTWVYTKFQKYSGNNTQQSVIASAICAVILFLVVFVVLGTVH